MRPGTKFSPRAVRMSARSRNRAFATRFGGDSAKNRATSCARVRVNVAPPATVMDQDVGVTSWARMLLMGLAGAARADTHGTACARPASARSYPRPPRRPHRGPAAAWAACGPAPGGVPHAPARPRPSRPADARSRPPRTAAAAPPAPTPTPGASLPHVEAPERGTDGLGRAGAGARLALVGFAVGDAVFGQVDRDSVWDSCKAVFTRMLDGVEPEVIEEIIPRGGGGRE